MPARLAHDPRHVRSAGVGRFRLSQSGLLGLAALIGLGTFILWLVITFAPVLRVEIQYQWRKLTANVFQTNSLAGLFFPNITVDLRGGTAVNTQDGIVIPKVYVDAPVVYNVDPNDASAYTVALRQGIAHASGTSYPDEGGLGYYFAHSSAPELRSQFNAVFYLLGKLEVGDEIFLWHDGQRYEYRVSETRVVPPSDVSFLQTSGPTETIVLQTCWPPGTTQQRKLVFAQRVTEQP